MSFTVTVANTPYFVEAGSLVVDKTIGKSGAASFKLITDTNTHFQQLEQVQVLNDSGRVVFSGYLNIPIKEQKPGFSQTREHEISCIDQGFIARKRVIAAIYTNKTCGFIAQDILKNILSNEGVTIGQIYDGLPPSPTLYPSTSLYPGGNVGPIPNATFVYCKVSEALDQLVKQASTSGIPYYWNIDENKKFYFVPYTAITQTNVIDGTVIDQVHTKPYVSRQNPTYRNTQYITGGVAQTLPQTNIRVGDGNVTTWTLDFDVYSISAITLDAVPKTYGIKGVDTGRDFYYQQGSPDISQDPNATKLTSMNVLSVSYIGQYPATFVASNTAQIAYQSKLDNTSGIIEDVLNDTTLTSTDTGLSEASQLLTRYAQQGVTFVGSTRQDGYAPGQLVPVDLPDYGLHNVQMLIESVVASDQVDGMNIWYQITAIMGPSDITWIDFFSTLLKQQQAASSINVGVAQTLTLLASLAVDAQTQATLSASIFTATFPSTSLHPSSKLYPG